MLFEKLNTVRSENCDAFSPVFVTITPSLRSKQLGGVVPAKVAYLWKLTRERLRDAPMTYYNIPFLVFLSNPLGNKMKFARLALLLPSFSFFIRRETDFVATSVVCELPRGT